MTRFATLTLQQLNVLRLMTGALLRRRIIETLAEERHVDAKDDQGLAQVILDHVEALEGVVVPLLGYQREAVLAGASAVQLPMDQQFHAVLLDMVTQVYRRADLTTNLNDQDAQKTLAAVAEAQPHLQKTLEAAAWLRDNLKPNVFRVDLGTVQ
jgi:hypothetical protein